MNYVYRPPTQADIAYVAANMRDEDVLEVAASDGHAPLQALTESILESHHSFCAVVDGVPVCIFGFVSDPGQERAAIWLLSSEDIQRYRRPFLVETRRILDYWTACFGTIFNMVSADSQTTLAWLRYLGFTVADEPVPYGPQGAPFYLVTRSDRPLETASTYLRRTQLSASQ